MRKIFTVLLLSSTLLLAWTYVNRIGDEQPAPGELIVYINSDTQPGEGVAAEARWPSGGPYSYANTRDQGTSEYGSFLGGTANWKVTFNNGVLPNNVSIDYQVMGIGTDNNFYSYSGFNWTVDASLPVELTTFTAFAKEKEVVLNWQTATEVNNYGFYVERLAKSLNSDVNTEQNNAAWKSVGFVEGHGNSNSPKIYSYSDNSVNSGKYLYRLKQVDNDGSFEYSKVVEVNLEIPTEFELAQNYPNPFNPTTTIKFSLPEASNIKLTVYNVIGEKITELLNGKMNAGYHSVEFGASSVSKQINSGVYIYSLQTPQKVINRKMILMK